MIYEYSIKSPDGPVIFFERENDIKDIEGWCKFNVTIKNAPITGTVEIDDLDPSRWAKYFIDLSENWRGWKGEKVIENIEETFSISASCDSTGHIYLNITLRPNIGLYGWQMKGEIMLESGALEEISKNAKKFFNYRNRK